MESWERTLFMIKPDGVKKGLVGECFRRIEDAGLKITGMKMVRPTRDQADRHYPNEQDDLEWFKLVAKKGRGGYEKKGLEFPYEDDMDYARNVKKWLVDYLSSAPVVAAVIEGPNAISAVRETSGPTEPASAEKGTIRGDFGDDSYKLANSENRALKNIVHASSSVKDAENEIKVWFTEDEIIDYKE
ncbi:MAG: nucleoside-diphosphate kinase [Candidatus Aenigmarchaeota archaeon]|nr:nucleoside-diphosphate kinase [Candidatus Aenigmarchaeota archaeon]